MRLKFIILLSVLSFFSFFSCDRYIFNISINNGNNENTFKFGCGSVTVKATEIGGIQLSLLLNFQLDHTLSMLPDNLRIFFQDGNLNSKIYMNESLVRTDTVIKDGDSVTIVIDGEFKEGDKMIINIDDFLNCTKQPLNLGDIELFFMRR